MARRVLPLLSALVLALAAVPAHAYPTYSAAGTGFTGTCGDESLCSEDEDCAEGPCTPFQDSNDTNCARCHGDFRDSPYISLSDGQSWEDDAHDVHRTGMLNRDCSTCHGSSGFSPVLLDSSAGGDGLAPISCLGCHGRVEPQAGNAVTGAGLRQRHWNNGVRNCQNCHLDSNPASFTPAGEKVLPPYYAEPGTGHPDIPDDPCNPAPDFPENFAATTLGTDNDGDNAYDAADPDCAAPTTTSTTSTTSTSTSSTSTSTTSTSSSTSTMQTTSSTSTSSTSSSTTSTSSSTSTTQMTTSTSTSSTSSSTTSTMQMTTSTSTTSSSSTSTSMPTSTTSTTLPLPDDQVPVCHKGRTIRVSRSAVPAHLAHGDREGICGFESRLDSKRRDREARRRVSKRWVAIGPVEDAAAGTEVSRVSVLVARIFAWVSALDERDDDAGEVDGQ